MLFSSRLKAGVFGPQYLAFVDASQQMKAVEVRYNKTANLAVKRDIMLCHKPIPLAEGDEILIKVKATSINSVDVELYRKPSLKNYLGFTIKPPYTMGRDFSGEVVALGPNASKFKVGDEVYGFVSIISKKPGTFAEYCKVTERSVARKPANLSHVQAAALPFTAFAAWHGIYDKEMLRRAGEKVLVLGASGGLGNMCAQVMKNVLQASVTVTMHKNNRPKALNEGYYMIVDPNDDEDMALMKERSYDVLIDATSNGVDEAFWHKYVRFGGKYVRYSGVDPNAVGDENQTGFPYNVGTILYSMATRMSSRLVNGVVMKRYFFQDSHPDVIGGNLEMIRYAAELNRLRPIIDSVYRLEEYPAAIERFEQRNGVKYGKIVLKVTDDADEIKAPV